ncbi:hypothetical protein L486_01409 [Kwoniella mangroviensis CBS 10435]|uniref:Uncharacterized protein n=1 Tax=Kwoniella mangroviensis CBS 10435 TaxID=1331196 RepID=A0A1B9J1T3_9TREE|nr:hypothetical protein L486_01409 [Kwoniella mangroviensis CBS 10435]
MHSNGLSNSHLDKNLRMYQALRSKWTTSPMSVFGKSLRNALKNLDLALDILKQDKKYDEFGEVYDQLFTLFAVHGRRQDAQDMARRALEHYSTVWGRDKALMGTDYGELKEDPTQHEEWGSLIVGAEQEKVKKKKLV